MIGPKDNRYFLQNLLQHRVFISGSATTDSLQQHCVSGKKEPDPQTLVIATVLRHEQHLLPEDKRSHRANWRTGDNSLPLHYRLQWEDRDYSCQLFCCGGHSYRVQMEEHRWEIDILQYKNSQAELVTDGVRSEQLFLSKGDSLYLLHDGRQWQFSDLTYASASSGEHRGNGKITVPMDGCILEVNVAHGQPVQRGDTLAVMEAMKMEHPLKADSDGTVVALAVSTGDQVRSGQLLMQIEV